MTGQLNRCADCERHVSMLEAFDAAKQAMGLSPLCVPHGAELCLHRFQHANSLQHKSHLWLSGRYGALHYRATR